MPKPVYPDVLKAGNWDKQKGILAKLVKGETGIGAACKKAQASFDAIDWTKMDGKKADDAGTPEEVDTFVKGMKAEYVAHFEPTRKDLFALSALATKYAGEFKKNPLIPKSSREYLEKMSTGASNFATGLKSCCEPDLKMAEAAKKRKALTFAKVMGDATLLAAFTKACKDFLSPETLEFYLKTKSTPSGGAAQSLYDNYCKVGSSNQINIDAGLVKKFDAANVSKKWGDAPWSAARRECELMLQNDLYPKFLKSAGKYI